MLLTIPYPAIGSVAFAIPLPIIGSIPIRWYALAYLAGLLLGYLYCLRLTRRPPGLIPSASIEDLLVWVTLGVVGGGRLGYVLFYRPGFYLADPIEIVQLWHGGMSFHGGCLGVIIAMALFARRNKLNTLALADIVVAAVPIGLFFGRLANFVNGELWGRPTDVSWAMVFPTDPDQLPRHPSQLYQASLEGLLLFLVLFILESRGVRRRPGLMSGVFLIGYSVARIIGELFRQPDQQITDLHVHLFDLISMGQILSLPMMLAGLYLVLRAKPLQASARIASTP